MIRNVRVSDASQIATIYNYYVINTHITFEMRAVSDLEMKNRISHSSKNYPWLVYQQNDEITGYAYATQWKPRGAYCNTAETTIYLKHGSNGNGVGTALYSKLIEQCKEKHLHTLIGGIGQPNEASVALHEKLGFRKVAHFREIGYKFDRWIDVAYWQLTI